MPSWLTLGTCVLCGRWQEVGPWAAGGSQDRWAAGHGWGPAAGREAPRPLAFAVARPTAPQALGRGEAFVAALAFGNVVLSALRTVWWRHLAVDRESPARLGAVGSIAASLHWGTRSH